MTAYSKLSEVHDLCIRMTALLSDIHSMCIRIYERIRRQNETIEASLIRIEGRLIEIESHVDK